MNGYSQQFLNQRCPCPYYFFPINDYITNTMQSAVFEKCSQLRSEMICVSIVVELNVIYKSHVFILLGSCISCHILLVIMVWYMFCCSLWCGTCFVVHYGVVHVLLSIIWLPLNISLVENILEKLTMYIVLKRILWAFHWWILLSHICQAK